VTEQDALTLTVWGEARGEPIEGQIGVAMVMRNRVLAKYRGATTYVDVCTAKAQFSAWTEEAAAMQSELELLTGDPQLQHHPDPTLRRCWEIARATIAGLLADNTGGSNHYLTAALYATATPVWAQGAGIRARLGAHVFLNVA
jgi:N-acetylmuramoyl-L-alanine amidase